MSAAPRGCETAQYAGLCAAKQEAKLEEESCDPVFQCAYKCKRADCDCVARCYEGHDQCEKLASAVERCVAMVCDSLCR